MTKSNFRFGKDALLQASQPKLLFESTQLPIQCWLEDLASGTRLERFSGQLWEEILLIRGSFDSNQNAYRDMYLCLTPEQSPPSFCAGNTGAVLLRMLFGNGPGNDNGAPPQGKQPVAIVDFRMLAWNEIPARRANDAGARIAELSINASLTRITSLMDCRPGWYLADHDHPSDVLTFCARGGGILGIENQSTVYEAGHLVMIPAGVRHRFEAGSEGALLAVFVFEPFLTGGYRVSV